MEKYIDLHTHSVFSDGAMTPTELVKHAAENNIAAISLTDHDGIGGVAEAMEAGEKYGVEVVPGIEFSAQSATETHILAYYIDLENKKLLEALKGILEVRLFRNKETARKLQEAGFPITYEDALEIAPNGIVGRAHFARIMATRGYTASVKEAFDKYLSNGRPCYCSQQLLTPVECVRLIKDIGGKAFLAHLHLTRLDDEAIKKFVTELREAGLDGIEGYYSEYTPEMQDKYQKLAADMGLKISGGTDFHGAMKPHISIGTGLGNLKIPYSVLENIK